MPNDDTPPPPPSDTIIDRLGSMDDLFTTPPPGETPPPGDTPPGGIPPPGETPPPGSGEGDDDIASFLDKKPEDKTPSEKKDDDDDVVPEGLTQKAGDRWKELKSEVKAWKKKFEEASTSQIPPEEIAKLKTAEAEITSLREKLQNYEKEITGVKLEATEEYQRAVTQPLDTLRNTVQDLADTYDLDLEALNSAVVEDNRKERVKKLAQLAETMLEPDRLKLYRAAEDFDKIVDTKTSLEENAAETLKRFEVERAEAARKSSVEQLRKQKEASDEMWELMTRKLPMLSDEATAKAIRAEADTVDFTSADPGIRAYGAYAGAALPRLVKVLRANETRIAELERQIAGYKGSAPAVGNGNPGGAPKAAPGSSFLDAIELGMGGR